MSAGRSPLARVAGLAAATLLFAGVGYNVAARSMTQPATAPGSAAGSEQRAGSEPQLARARSVTCTFAASDSRYYRGRSADAAGLLGTGPISFAWQTGTGAVSATGGSWREFLTAERVWVTYGNVIDGGTVSAAGSVHLELMGTPIVAGQEAYHFALSGKLSAMAGPSRLTATAGGPNLFVASGTVTCGGSSAPAGPSTRPPRPNASSRPARTAAPHLRTTRVVRTAASPTCSQDDDRDDDEDADDDDDDRSSSSCDHRARGRSGSDGERSGSGHDRQGEDDGEDDDDD